jgi:hypothetical protein
MVERGRQARGVVLPNAARRRPGAPGFEADRVMSFGIYRRIAILEHSGISNRNGAT